MMAFVRGVMARGDRFRVRSQPIRFDIDQHRLRAGVIHRFDRGGKGVGVDDHLVSGADAEAQHREQQRVGSGRRRRPACGVPM